jgi:hypothetical protein
VKLAGPGDEGTPLITPPADRLKPAGNDPEETDQVYPPAPPVAKTVWLYAVPTIPFGKEEVVIVSWGAPMVTVSD